MCLSAIVICFGLSFAGKAHAYTYSTSGTLTSINLLSGQIVWSIDSFVYNLSAKPAGTTATVQFSQDNTVWYNSSSVTNGTDTLTTGANNSINLSSLQWVGGNFYYKVAFSSSDGEATPVFDDITLNYTGGANNPPNNPTNSTPTDGQPYRSATGTLVSSSYSDTESDAQTDAQWQVDDDSDFSSPIWTRTAGGAEMTIAMTTANGTFANELSGQTQLAHGVTYYWRVRYSDGNWSSWSNTTGFRVTPYYSPAYFSSVNLLSGRGVASIGSFDYTLSAKPTNTDATVQFSQDNATWYNSANTLNGSDTLTTGTNSISLATLAWTGSSFYYRVTMTTSDGLGTPVLDDITVIYTATTATWDGSSSNDWSVGANWDIGSVPGNYHDIIIADVTNQPVMSANTGLHNLTINSGAELDIAGYTVTFNDSGTFTNNGTLKLNGSETLTNFTNDTDSGTVMYKGTDNQTGLVAGNTYNNFTINGAATYTLNASLDVNNDLTLQNGVLSTGTNNQTVGGSFLNYSGSTAFTPSTSTLTMDATAGTKDIVSGGESFYNLTLNDGGGSATYELEDSLDIVNNLTITGGTLDTKSGENNSIAVGGNFTNSDTFTARSGTVTFDATDTGNTFNPGASSFYGVTFNGSGGSWDLTSNTLDVDSALTITNGTFDLNGQNLTTTGATFTNDGTLALQGSETLTNFTNDTDSGAVMYNGTANQTGLIAGNTYNNLTINDGLVGYWPFDTGSGTSAPDVSGYGNHGTLTNGPTWSSSVSSTIGFTDPYSLSFNGVSDYVTVPDNSALSPSSITVSAWINSTGISAEQVIASKFYNQTSIKGWEMEVYQSKLYFAINTNAVLQGSTTMTSNTWYHLVSTYDGNTIRVYVNGILDGSSSTAAGITNPTGNMNIGRYTFSTNLFFNGLLDDVRIYNRALTATEVSSLAAGTAPASATATYTLNAALDVNGDFTLASGGVNTSLAGCSTAPCSISLAGNWLNYGGVFTPQAGTVTLDGTATGKTLQSGGQAFTNLTVSGSGGGWTLGDRLDVTGTYTQSTGTVSTSSDNHNVTVGDFDQTGGTFTANSSTLTLNSSSNQTVNFSSAQYNLQIEDPTESGLVGYWPFNSGSGTSAPDVSGNGNHGTLTNGVTWSTTVNSTTTYDNPYSLSFDGTDDYVTVGDATSLNPSTAITISAWANVSSLSSHPFIIDKGYASSYWLQLFSNGAVEFGGKAAAGSYLDSDAGGISTGSWHHIVGTFDTTIDVIRIYINGTLAKESTTASGDLGTNTNALIIGQQNNLSGSRFSGLLDDIRIYNRALSSTEVANLAAGKYADGDNSTATYTLSTALDVNNDLFIQSGVLSPGSNSLAVGGNWNNYSGSSGFVAGTSTATFDKASGTQTLDSGGSAFYNLTHSGAGILQLITNALTVSNNLTNSGGTFDANGLAINLAGDLDNNGGVYTANGNTLTLTGTNQSILGSATFYNLVKSVSSAATLTFEAAKTFIISNILTLQGAANNLLSLVSSIVGTQFNINIPSSFTLNFLNIKDLNNSNATNRTVTNSQNSGNNTNITFAATTVTWTGTTSTNWATGSNWDVGYVPNTTDNVVIPDVTNDPILDTNRTVNNLTINSGGLLSINGNNLTLTGTVSNDGTLKLQGGETLTGFTNDTDSGTVLYVGTSTYASLAAGNTYYNVTFNGSGGSWTMNAGATINNVITITAGTLSLGSQTLTLAGTTGTSLVNNGTFTASTGTVAYTGNNAGGNTNITNVTYNNLTLNNASETYVLGADASIGGNLTITNGTFSDAGFNTNIGGSWSNAGSYTGTGTVVFNAASGTQTLTSGGTGTTQDFQNITKSTGGTLQFATNAVDIDGTLQINSGTVVDINALAITAGTLVNNGTLLADGSETITITTKDTDSGLVKYDGSSSYTTALSYGNTYYDLEFAGSGVWEPSAAVTTNRNLTITSGTFDIDGQNLTVTGTFSNLGTLRLLGTETLSLTPDTDSGTISYDNSSALADFPSPLNDTYYNLTLEGTGTVTLANNLTVTNTLTLTSGSTLVLNSFNLNVAGNLVNSGTLTQTSASTITLNGTTQTFTPGSGNINAAVDITGSSGTVSAGSSFTISNILSIAQGRTLALVNYVLTLGTSLLTNLGLITENSGYIAGTSSNLYIADSSFDVNDAISLGSELLYISLTDQDANLNGQSANTLTGTVVTCSTDSETVTLTETGNATEVFRNSGLTTQAYDGSATNNDGTLECSDGTTITATYTDPQDAADTRNDTALATGEVIPTAPSSFAGSAPSSTSITWTWTDNASNETGFKLYDSSNTLIATIATANATSYTETGLTKGTSYTRKIAAYNVAGNSSYSSSASVTTPAEPTAPSNLAGTADSSTAITWSWTDNSNDEATWVLQNSSGTDLASFSTSTGSATGGTITYQETGLTKGTAYVRQVVARNTDGTSSPTSQVSVTTKADAPSSPSLVSPSNNATITTSETTQTNFTFNRSQDDDDGISHYVFVLNPGASNERTFTLGNPDQGATVVYSDRQVTGTATRIFVIFTDSSILPKGSYTWKVRAFDNGGNTGDSDIRAFTVVDEVTTTTTTALTPALSQSGRGDDDATLAQETAITTPSITDIIEQIIQGETPSKAPTGFQLDELMKQARQRSALQADNLWTFLSSWIPYEWLAQFDAMLDNTLATLRSYTLSWSQRTLLALGRLFDHTGNQLRALAQLWTSGLEQFAAVRREAALALAGFTQEQIASARHYLRTQQEGASEIARTADELLRERFPELTQEQITLLAGILSRQQDAVIATADNAAQARREAQENLTEPLPRLAGALLVWTQDTISQGHRFLLAGRANRLELAAGQERRFNLVIQPLANAAQWVQLGVRVAWDGARGHYNHPLEIREVAITELTPHSVVIEWQTSRLTRGKLNWGESISYGNEVHLREYGTHHRVELTDLAPGKQYVFEVVATGIRGAQTYDAFYGFTTPAK